ncbi:MAG: methyltransferase domain-containing protein [Bacteroidetes bacterium]|jgi:ubiquinone/menaquinone biosynthesis C-methylase UbiE|nr:methyltransferase domain-containing protein [Bacteroidota bacterium]
MDTKDFEKAQGHWILARMGKKVLRPGGKELTQKLVSELHITDKDDVVEFAPGLGYTATLALKGHPHSYTGVDADEDAVVMLKQKVKGDNVRFMLGNANHTELSDNSKDKVWGEAMLTMHADHRKAEIIREAYRILKKGGLYAIHELGLKDVDENLKSEIQRDLALTIKVNARPLTEEEWKSLLEKEGFTVRKIYTNEMLLLETKRILDDEGFFRTLKIGYNIMVNTSARKRITEMRKSFRKHQKHINSIVIVAQKN